MGSEKTMINYADPEEEDQDDDGRKNWTNTAQINKPQRGRSGLSLLLSGIPENKVI